MKIMDALSGMTFDSLSKSGPILQNIGVNRTLESFREKSGFAEILSEELSRGKEQTPKGTDKKLMDVCYDMEAMFIGIMLKSMRKTVVENDFFGKSMAKDIFQDMLYDEYAGLMARTDQFGLAHQIFNQLSV
jgi:flagellar protein FlgJ